MTNTGNIPLTGVTVTDDKIGAITCPADTLAVGANMTCTATGTAIEGQYANMSKVTTNENVEDEDPSHYYGFIPEEPDPKIWPVCPVGDDGKPISSPHGDVHVQNPASVDQDVTLTVTVVNDTDSAKDYTFNGVTVNLQPGESHTFDPVTKTVAAGATVIFEQVPNGTHQLSWDGGVKPVEVDCEIDDGDLLAVLTSTNQRNNTQGWVLISMAGLLALAAVADFGRRRFGWFVR